MTRIVVLGDLNLDVHAQIPDKLAPGDEVRDAITVRPGGSAGTFARTAAQLGAAVTFIGAVGNDLVGDLLETSLVRAGVMPALNRTNLPSGAVLAIQMAGDRSMVCARGANDGLTAGWVSQSLPDDSSHLHISGYALLSDAQREAAIRALAIAGDYGMTRSLDPPPDSLIRSFGVQRYLDLLPEGLWLFPNQAEGRVLSGLTEDDDIVDALCRHFPIGACTLGANGAKAWAGSTRHQQRSESLSSVDTTGAGDVYAATFVTRYLQTTDLALANSAACEAAFCMLRDRLVTTA